MSIRTKSALILGTTFLVLLIGLVVAARFIILKSFLDLEEQKTLLNSKRVAAILKNNLSTLEGVTSDWAYWDDTYTFIEDANQTYITSNLAGGNSFINNELNLIVYIDTAGKIVFAKAFDLAAEKEIPVPESLKNHLTVGSLLLSPKDEDSGQTGLVSLPEGTLLISARAILTSERKGPSRGVLIFGRYLNTQEVQKLADITKLALHSHGLDEPDLPTKVKESLLASAEKNPIAAQPSGSQTTSGYVLLKDIYGKPVRVLELHLPRDIYQSGQKTLIYFLVAIFSLGVVFGLIGLVVLNKMVLSRLRLLAYYVAQIGQSGNFASRLPEAGGDEIVDLSVSINKMLQGLESSQAKLVENEKNLRVKTQELERLNRTMIGRELKMVELKKALREAQDETERLRKTNKD